MKNLNINQINLDIFPIPISILTLGESSRELNKSLVDAIEADRKLGTGKTIRTGVHVWQSDINIEERHESFKQLKEIVDGIYPSFLHNIGYKPDVTEYTRSAEFWGNINESPYAYHTPHFHGYGDTIFSGIYYPSSGVENGVELSDVEDLDLMTDVKSSSIPDPGCIAFMDPSLQAKRQVYPKNERLNRYPYYGLEICVRPKAGTMILFPNYLTHFVVPTEKHNFIRYSIPFGINLIR